MKVVAELEHGSNFLYSLLFQKGPHYGAQSPYELMTLLLLLRKRWAYRRHCPGRYSISS